MAVWHVDWEDKIYDLDIEAVTVQQGIVIKGNFGWTIKEWSVAMSNMDPEAWQALFWVMKVQSGQACNMRDLDFPVAKYAAACEVAAQAAGDAEAIQGNGAAPVGQNIPASVLT
jgi:hypothetical protein